MKKLSIAIITSTLLFSQAQAEFNLFGNKNTNDNNKIKTKDNLQENNTKKELSILSVDKDNETIPNDEIILTEEELFLKKQKMEEEELLRLKKQSLEDYLSSMKRNEREDYINTLNLISEIEEKRKFNKEPFNKFIEKKVKFIDVMIPFQQIIHINFDKKIVKLETSSNKNLKIDINSETASELIIVNKDLKLNHNMKLTFADGTSKNFILKYGNNPSERYVLFNYFMGKTKMEILPEFKKKLAIRNIHSYFNHVSTKLILDKLLNRDSWIVLEENKKVVNKVLFDGKTQIDDIYGKNILDYTLTLNTVYETPYVEDVKNSEIRKKRLVVLELNVKNNNFSTLILTPEFIKKRFSNFTAFYIGNLELKENEIRPNQSKQIIVVIEDEYIDN